MTRQGTVEGTLVAGGNVAAFAGIPYAEPPVGDLRWKPPVQSTPWTGVREAKRFGSRCIQQTGYPDMVFRDDGESEDCLTLNVWAPENARPGSLPVMVWIYGGGYTGGSTSEPRQDGRFLARRNVVIVSMNYRLGIFGFLALPELSAESPHHASGNYGLLDQAAAIDWVERNIRSFGGDPTNITIFGESAGAFSVSALMVSPLSKDHFQRAIGESGAAFENRGLEFPPRESSEQAGAEFAEHAFHTSKLADLRKVAPVDLVRAATAKAAPAPPRFGPDIDGYFLTDSVSSLYASGQQAHIPLLAGWNADEARSAVTLGSDTVTTGTFKAQAQAEFGADAVRFLELYPASNDAEAARSAGDLSSDRFIDLSTWRWMEEQVRTGQSPVYRYRFDLGAPGSKYHPAVNGGDAGAFHSDEIEYVFGTLDSRPEARWRPQDRQLSDQVQTYWTNFARSGNPNRPTTAHLPRWPTYEESGGWLVLHLGSHSEARPDAERRRYQFLESRWAK